MGCEDLYEITPSEEVSFSDFSGKTIAIDAVFWLDRYYHAVTKKKFSREVRVVGENYHISQTLSLLVSVPDLLRNNITPVFFFDPPKGRFNNSKADAQIPYLEDSPISDPEKQFPFLQRSTELVMEYLDISYYEAPQDAEADASIYVKHGEADMVVSNDYDTLLYQAPVTVRKEPYSQRWKRVSLEETLKQNEISYRELLDIAILTGTDEIMGLYKNHIDDAVEKVKKVNNLDEFEENKNSDLRAPSGRISDESPTFRELHSIYRDPSVSHSVQRDILNNTDPSISDPELNNLRRYLVQMLKMDNEIVNDLITPIEREL